jgi:hypothetical protein
MKTITVRFEDANGIVLEEKPVQVSEGKRIYVVRILDSSMPLDQIDKGMKQFRSELEKEIPVICLYPSIELEIIEE